jgi:hypothetical protein
MEMARKLGPQVTWIGFVAQDQPVDLRFLNHRAAAMIGQHRVMIARDPGPARGGSERNQPCARFGREAVASLAIVETVAQAPDFARPRLALQRRQLAQRRDRIVGRKHLADPRVPARFLKVQVSDQQGLARGPIKSTGADRRQVDAAERKANHGPL